MYRPVFACCTVFSLLAITKDRRPLSRSYDRQSLAAARSRRGSDIPPACHSLPRRRCATPQAPPLLYYLCPAAHFFDRLKTASVHRTEAVPVTIHNFTQFQISARINTPRPNRSYAWRACRSRRRPRRASPARRGCSARTSPPSPSCPARTAGHRTTWS